MHYISLNSNSYELVDAVKSKVILFRYVICDNDLNHFDIDN